MKTERMIQLNMLLLVGAAVAGNVHAADPPAAGMNGPLIKGVCVLNRGEVFSVSKVARFVNDGYKHALGDAQADINRDRDALQSDAKALQDKKPKLKTEEYSKSERELSDRLAQLQKRATDSSQQLETTRRGVVEQISVAAQPVIEQVYKDRGCGLLLAREAVLAGNVGMDITSDVIAGLDKKITELPFTPLQASAATSK
jgi:Skp family chaperone for outer membrane proteins